MGLVAGDRFVGVEEDAAGLGPGREFGGVAGGRRALPDLKELGRVFGVSRVVRLLVGDEFLERRTFGGLDLASDREAEGEGEAIRTGRRRQEASGERTGGFDEDGVIEQRQRLLRRIAIAAERGAFIAGGSVEVDEHRVQEHALPMHVQATAPLVRTAAGDIGTVRKLDRLVIAGRLVGLGAGAADVGGVQQARDGERVVADEFGVESAGILGGEQTVGRIDLLEVGAQAAALAVGLAGDHQADHALHVPTLVAELEGEPFEQFRVRRKFALRTEVIEHGGEAGAVERLPEAVHERT